MKKALANAKEAHDLAMSCHYYWGHHEALRQLRGTCRELHDDANFNFWNDAEQALTKKFEKEKWVHQWRKVRPLGQNTRPGTESQSKP